MRAAVSWLVRAVVALGAAAVLGLSAGCGTQSESVASPAAARAMAAVPARPASAQKRVADFYKARSNRPVWTDGRALKPAATLLAEQLATAEVDGLDPDRYGGAKLTAALAEARAGKGRAVSRVERLLSRSYADYVLDLRRSGPEAVTGTGEAPTQTHRTVLEAAAAAPSLAAHVSGLRDMHPVYEGLRTALANHRDRWSALPRTAVPPGVALRSGARGIRVRALRERLGLSPSERYDPALVQAVKAFQTAHGLTVDGVTAAATVAALNVSPELWEGLILANMDRARSLPADPGQRHVLVDVAAGRLWLYENGRVRDSMKVIVGNPATPTPVMSGTLLYAVYSPYWNIPEDLVRDRIAPRVLTEGAGRLAEDDMEILSDWSDQPRVVKASAVDWRAVAEGRTGLRVRQKPGPENMMGTVKFMFPNDLGIYLHDTPNKQFFALPERAFSAGCVRVEDARRLARWLYGGTPPTAGGGRPERRVDLPAPVPVHITYLTAAAGPDGALSLRKDVYGRDPALLATLERRRGGPVQMAEQR